MNIYLVSLFWTFQALFGVNKEEQTGNEWGEMGSRTEKNHRPDSNPVVGRCH